MTIRECLKGNKIVPVVVLQKLEDAERVLGGLYRGGIRVAEICFRTDCAEAAIRYAVKKYPKMIVGAGTVIDGVQCSQAIHAGAKFVVSPGISEEAALVCMQNSVPYLPGVATATEIIKAIALGIETVKFFPAEENGGLKALKALSAAFPQMTFVPTGGINECNIKEYLGYDKVIACGGSWMTKGSEEEIEENARRAVELV